METSSGSMHVLSNIDTEYRTATCSECGTVDIQNKNGSTMPKWCCGNKRRMNSRARIRKSTLKRPRFQEQDGRCAICNVPIEIKSAHLDHDHITGRIRGMLCRDCNWGLGNFKDSIESLRRAIQYLENYLD